MYVQIELESYKSSDPISILSFLRNFRTACDSNGLREGAAMWLFQHLMRNQTKFDLARRSCATKEDDAQKEGNLTTYC